MGKKMKLPSLFKPIETSSSWPWPNCGSPKTLSFRAGNDIFKTINSAYINTTTNHEVLDTPINWLCNSSESKSFLMAIDDPSGEAIETVIQGLSSERLFFEPGETSSILAPDRSPVETQSPAVFSYRELVDVSVSCEGLPFKESVVMGVESRDPFGDFKRSIEEMVEAHGLKDWECLEELLSWYLKVNEESNHGYIVGAFVDLLVGFSFASVSGFGDHCSSNTTNHSFTSPLSDLSSSTFTGPCLSSLEAEDEVEKIVDNAS